MEYAMKYIEQIYKKIILIFFCITIGIILILVVKTKYKELKINIQKNLLLNEIKNETDYEFDNFYKNKNDMINNLTIPCIGTITSRYGFRNSNNPIVSSNHMGIDIGAPKGTDILSAHNGTVIEAGIIGSYGQCVMIQDKELITVYAHCSKLMVKKGDSVKQKEKIAEVGMTGNATGNHLHFEIRYNGEHINPEEVIDWL